MSTLSRSWRSWISPHKSASRLRCGPQASARSIKNGGVRTTGQHTGPGYASRMGSSLLILVVGLFALWICWKFTQRRRFLKQLNVARITPEELRDRLEAGEDLLIVDLRTKLDGDSGTIPGAVRISAEDLTAGAQAIPRDREVILFCS